MTNENRIVVSRLQEKGSFAIFSILGLFSSLVISWSLISDINSSTKNIQYILVKSLLLIVFVPYTAYNIKMLLGKRFVFEINDTGIKLKNGILYRWDNLFGVKINKYPTQGLRTIYYLLGPRGIFFYSINLYHDLTLKNRTTISFSSDINISFDEIENALIDKAAKYNINFL
jgi:hypothetical protein